MTRGNTRPAATLASETAASTVSVSAVAHIQRSNATADAKMTGLSSTLLVSSARASNAIYSLTNDTSSLSERCESIPIQIFLEGPVRPPSACSERKVAVTPEIFADDDPASSGPRSSAVVLPRKQRSLERCVGVLVGRRKK